MRSGTMHYVLKHLTSYGQTITLDIDRDMCKSFKNGRNTG